MKLARRVALLLSILAIAAVGSGEAPTAAVPPPPRLSAAVEGYYYHRPADADSVLGIASIDVGRGHVEARYNYEDIRTGSAFLGMNIDVVLFRKLELRITPMAGLVHGRTSGVAPGLEIDAKLWKLELSSESEYVLNGADAALSFFYSWSELSLRPLDWARGGLVLQRTRFVKEERIIEHGLVIGLTLGPLDLSAYVFDPFRSGRYYALALGASL